MKYNSSKTSKYFSDLADIYSAAKAPRDEIVVKLIPKKARVIDFGCGGGGLSSRLLKRGVDIYAIEPNKLLYGSARKRLGKRVKNGGIETLARENKNSFDFVLIIGVFQYLPEPLRVEILKQVRRVLRPGGRLLATFQNALFDVFTFNKWTVDFYDSKIFKPLGLNARQDLEKLIVNSRKPEYNSQTARDNIFVETANPLTIADDLKPYGFSVRQKYFYSFYPVPPLLEKKHKAKVEKLRHEFEIKRATEWHGYLLAGAFLVDSVKR